MQIAGLVLLVWLLARERFLLAGLTLGLLVAFKPNVASVALTLGGGWLVSRQVHKLARVVVGALDGAALAVALSSWFFGSARCWSDWLEQLGRLMQEGAWDDVNFALPRVLREVAGLGQLAWLGWRAPLAFFGVLWVRRATLSRAVMVLHAGAPLSARRFDVFLMGVGATLPLLTSELAWYHYFVGVLPLCLYLLRPAGELDGPPPSLSSRLACVAALIAVSLEAPRMLFDLSQEAHMALVAAGAVLAMGLACHVLWRLESATRSPGPR